VTDKKKLTKKERIEKIMNDVMNKSKKITKEDMISGKNKKNKNMEEKGDEDNRDDLSDLNEFDKENENEEG